MDAEENAAGRGGQGRMAIQGSGVARGGAGQGAGGQMVPVQNTG